MPATDGYEVRLEVSKRVKVCQLSRVRFGETRTRRHGRTEMFRGRFATNCVAGEAKDPGHDVHDLNGLNI